LVPLCSLLLSGVLGALDGEIRVLYLGDPKGSTPFMDLLHEPGIEPTPIPSFVIATSYHEGLRRRAMRGYFPRTYRDLLAFDVLILSDVRASLLTEKEVNWMFRSVTEEGTGLSMIGGLDSFQGIGNDSWYESSLGGILPVIGGRGIWSPARLRWVDEKDPFISSLPFSQIGSHGDFRGYNQVVARPGAKVISTMSTRAGDVPLMTYWVVGQGRVFTFASEWKGNCVPIFCRLIQECHLGGTHWGDAFSSWEHYPDFASNLVRFLAGEPFPDLSLVHLFREKARQLELRKSLAFSMVDFLDKADVPTTVLERLMAEANLHLQEARSLYASNELDRSLGQLDLALESLAEIGDRASSLKREHLRWIYGSEYAALLATSLLLGLAAHAVYRSGWRRGKARGPLDGGR